MAKKKSNSRLPKRVAGLKVPKRIRKGPIGDFLASPAGKALIAASVTGIGAGATAKTDTAAGRAIRHPVETLEHAGRKAGHAGSDAVDGAGAMSATLAFALGEAARSFAEAIRSGPRSGGRLADIAERGDFPDPQSVAASRPPS